MGIDWRQEIRGLTREAFQGRYDHPFLLVLDGSLGPDPDEYMSIITQDLAERPAAGEPGSVVPLTKSEENPYETKIIVGRARNCDAVLRHPSVSKFHAEIRLVTLEVGTVTDRESHNGTRINDMEAAPAKKVPIEAGDRIRFGAVLTVFLDPGRLYDALI